MLSQRIHAHAINVIRLLSTLILFPFEIFFAIPQCDPAIKEIIITEYVENMN
jgi:hypothetical protein|tara:strand:+ start:765 stop:920 length:156 start_codon:yes stop_codon:yes gene_type:complete